MTNPLAQDLGGVALDIEQLSQRCDSVDVYGYIRQSKRVERKCYEFLLAHSAEIAVALRDAERWQPIESAPRDGSEIWAYNGEQARMHWIQGEGYALWVWSDELLSDADPNPEQPTHWRPLPQPPAMHAPGGAGGGDHG